MEPAGRRIVCVDGPLAGAEVTVAVDSVEVVLHDPRGDEVHYRIDDLLTVFPGGTYAARVVTPPGPTG